jgi:cardiolipin synthase (CMP-forming)
MRRHKVRKAFNAEPTRHRLPDRMRGRLLSDTPVIYTLPNILTLSRIGAIPVVVAFLYVGGPVWAWAACAVFTLAAVTDWLDGYIARARDEQSDFGAFLDPIADKLLVAACLMVLVAQQRIDGLSVFSALVILCREILVSGLREFLAKLRIGLPVSKLAKWKTAIQMVAIGVLIVGDDGPVALPTKLLGEVGLGVAAALTMVTGYDYLRAALKHMRGPASRPTSKPVTPSPLVG